MLYVLKKANTNFQLKAKLKQTADEIFTKAGVMNFEMFISIISTET